MGNLTILRRIIIGHAWAFEAEVMSIQNALSLCHQFNFKIFVIESDSTNAVGWANNGGVHPWKLLNVFNTIGYLKIKTNCLGIAHIYRESNSLADSLTKQGSTRQDVLWAVIEPL